MTDVSVDERVSQSDEARVPENSRDVCSADAVRIPPAEPREWLRHRVVIRQF